MVTGTDERPATKLEYVESVISLMSIRHGTNNSGSADQIIERQ